MNRNENIEIDLLLEAIHRKYGYDFRSYSKAAMRRRVRHRLNTSGLQTISDMIHRLLHDQRFFESLLSEMTINVTEMFRDPRFFRRLRDDVVPDLKRRSFAKIWHAGCATGEEVYSTAILLREEGMADKCRIYATDIDETVLRKARQGIFPIGRMKDYTRNYIKAGGRSSFSDYYAARYDHAILDKSLTNRIVFSDHNLVTDGIFGEMDLIICRNVLIYFGQDLQARVIGLFSDSLGPDGYLCLGTKESLLFSAHADRFNCVADRERIYQKKTVVQ